MQQQTRLSVWCERIIEAGWLLALSLIPIYFNLLSARHFEPDKATTLRAIVLVMAAAALIRLLERLNTPGSHAGQGKPTTESTSSASNPFGGLWQRLNSVPLALPVLFYVLVFVVTTFTSVVPHTSFWGSYQRLQGTYTNLSYVLLFVIVVATLRRREQLERLITVSILVGLTVASYGLLQHFQLDPLPWRGDVITRVASTMGNAIFVAAYLIMIVPLALYRAIVKIDEAQQASTAGNWRSELLWAVASVLLIVGTLALLLSVIKFGAVVRTVDLRYWWLFPGGVILSTALWCLLTLRPAQDSRGIITWIAPGILFMVYIVMFTSTYAVSASSSTQVQAIDERIVNGLDWWLWLVVSVVCISGFYVLSFLVPRRSAAPSRLSLWLHAGGALFAVLIMMTTTLFTQSRGPQLGLLAGLFVFLLLLLWQEAGRAKRLEALRLARNLRIAAGSLVALAVAVSVFLVIFNTTYTPFFNQLRAVPYIGRMGYLLDPNGTARVRSLIWFGDEHAGGAVDLITHDPWRSFVGWGPESMFVAYNPFYPPELAEIESRGASPDRSHQAILDVVITRGFVGLISYFFLMFSYVGLAWRLMRRSQERQWQVFFLACLCVVTAHFAESLVGIPIVSTLTMFWVTLGITVTGGMLAGHYVIGAVRSGAQQPEAEAAEEANGEEGSAAPPAGDTPGKRKGGRKRGGRGTSSARVGAARVASSRRGTASTNPAAYALYALIAALMLGGVWWFNLSTIYADMRFHEGQSLGEQPNAGLREQILAMDKFITTINNNPREDFYYLNLGRTMMNIAQQLRAQEVPLGTETDDVDVDEVLALGDVTQVATFVQNHTPLEVMSYARAVLERARELNTMNKDHYANLARLNNFWYQWTQDLSKLQQAADWYRQANEIAPQDVTLLNEHANVLMMLSTTDAAHEGEQNYQQRAIDLLERSYELDSKYADTSARLAEMYRLNGQLAEAADMYVQAIERNPDQINPLVERIAASYQSQPELLNKLSTAYMDVAKKRKDPVLYSISGLLEVRAGDMEGALEPYKQAAALAPRNLENRRNYTIVLSDTQHYDEALQEARAALELAQNQEGKENDVRVFEHLITLLQPKVAGGQ